MGNFSTQLAAKSTESGKLSPSPEACALRENLKCLFTSTAFPNRAAPFTKIAEDILSSDIDPKFYPLFRNFYVAIKHRSFIAFYNEYQEELKKTLKSITEITAEQLLKNFIDSFKEVTLYRSDLYNPDKHARTMQTGLLSHFQAEVNGDKVKREELIARKGFPDLVMNTFESPLGDSNETDEDFKKKFFLSCAYADPNQTGSNQIAKAVSQQISVSYHRANMVDSASLGSRRTADCLLLEMWEKHSLVTYEIQINPFYVVTQSMGNVLTEANPISEENSKTMIVRLPNGELSTTAQQNRLFECHVERIPADCIISATIRPLNQGLGMIWGSLGEKNQLLFTQSHSAEKGSHRWTAIGIDRTSGTFKKQMLDDGTSETTLHTRSTIRAPTAYPVFFSDQLADFSNQPLPSKLSEMELFAKFIKRNIDVGACFYDEAKDGPAPENLSKRESNQRILKVFHDFCDQAHIEKSEELDAQVLKRFGFKRQFLSHIDYDAKYRFHIVDND